MDAQFFKNQKAQLDAMSKLVGIETLDELLGARKKGKPDCEYCEGTGVATFPNGPDDYDRDECICIREEKEKLDEIRYDTH